MGCPFHCPTCLELLVFTACIVGMNPAWTHALQVRVLSALMLDTATVAWSFGVSLCLKLLLPS